MTPFIVAEISKSWINGEAVSDTPILAVSFERVIEVNRQRGYRLHSFQLHQLMVSRADDVMADHLVETIIAVFEAVPAANGERSTHADAGSPVPSHRDSSIRAKDVSSSSDSESAEFDVPRGTWNSPPSPPPGGQS